MATIERIVVRLDGWPGAPGFMTFYTSDAGASRSSIQTFLNAWKNAVPNAVTFTIPAEGDVIDDSTGNLTGSWTAGTPITITGTGGGAFAAATGACITWYTNTVVTGPSGKPRRLRGRTFMVPLAPVAFDSDGTITAASLATFRTSADALRVAINLRVWHRPTTPGGSDGLSTTASSSNVADKAAVLRSRRD